MSYDIKQSTTAYPLVFLMVDSTDHVTGKTGLTPTVTISKAGGSFASPSGAVSEIANGWYKVAGNATDTGTLGPLILHATGTAADPVDILYNVIAYDPQDTVRLGLTAMPNVASGNSGAIVTAGTGTAQISTSSGRVTANTDQLAGQTVTAAAGVTFPTSVASPTNITAGTITTVTNLTNAATSGDFTSTMKTSIGTAVAASAVASVTGNVGGNVTGSVGSVATGGITAASIAADAIGASELAADAVAEIADAVWDELVSGHLVDGSFGAYMNGLAVTSGDLFLATSSTARLNQSTASANNYAYEGCWLVITAGPGAGQARLIYQYIGTSKQCSITPDWTTTPDGTSNYVVIPAGAINSVYGAVGSVTGAVATVTALGTQAKADVNAEVVDALTTDTYAEPGQGAPAATLSLAGKIGYLFKAWRNKSTQTSTAYNLYNDDAATVDQKATTSDDGTVFTRGEVSTGP